MTKNYLFLGAIASLILLLGSCGGGSVSLYVNQDGTTLIVDGRPYERRRNLYLCNDGVCVAPASRAQYATGEVLVHFTKADAPEVTAMIAGLGLSIIAEKDLATGYSLQIAVPPLFEEQWVQILSNQPLITAAYTNDFLYLATPGAPTTRVP